MDEGITFYGKRYYDLMEIVFVIDEMPIYELMAMSVMDICRAISVLDAAVNQPRLFEERTWHTMQVMEAIKNDLINELDRSCVLNVLDDYMYCMSNGHWQRLTDDEYAYHNPIKKSFYEWLSENNADSSIYIVYDYFKYAPLHIKKSTSRDDYSNYLYMTAPKEGDALVNVTEAFEEAFDIYERNYA